MLLKGRTCLDIAQQLQAVEKAVQQAKKTLIKDHMDHCLTRLVGLLTADQQRTLNEFKDMTRYL